jgi:adenylate kinase
MDAGDLVPDEITAAMLTGRLAEPDAHHGFLLDGFPRTIAQAHQLQETLAERGTPLECVLELVVDEDELIRRLSVRRTLVDGQWVVRDDDNPETVRNRLAVYREFTAPLSDLYTAEGLLERIDGTGEIETVAERALSALRQHSSAAQ